MVSDGANFSRRPARPAENYQTSPCSEEGGGVLIRYSLLLTSFLGRGACLSSTHVHKTDLHTSQVQVQLHYTISHPHPITPSKSILRSLYSLVHSSHLKSCTIQIADAPLTIHHVHISTSPPDSRTEQVSSLDRSCCHTGLFAQSPLSQTYHLIHGRRGKGRTHAQPW